MTVNATVAKVTARIVQRSQATRAAYIQQVDEAAARKPGADRLGCANVAHAFAAMPAGDKSRASGLTSISVVNATELGPNIGQSIYQNNQKTGKQANYLVKRCYSKAGYLKARQLVALAQNGQNSHQHICLDG